MCGEDQARFCWLDPDAKQVPGPRYKMSKEMKSPAPESQTIYPLTPADTPPHIDGDIVYRHAAFLCRAVQDFVGNPSFGERSIRRGELTMIVRSRTGTTPHPNNALAD
jgi:hypothetical protein